MDDSRLPGKTAKEPDRSITLLDKWKFMLALSADRRLNGTDLRCATIIADHFNVGRGYAWPSYAAISSRTGMCRRSIANSVAKLDRLGIISLVSGGKGRANRYYPAWALSADDNPTEITGSDDPTCRERCIGAASDTGREGYITPVAKDASPPSRKVHSIPLTPVASSEGGSGIPAAGGAALAGGSLRPRGGGPGKDGFEEFWKSYPKKEGHAAAKKEYAKAIAAGVTAETLTSKARQYAKAKAEVDAKWLKMPANWLKEECWLEDPQPSRPREPRPARAAKALGKRQERAHANPKQQVPVANSAVPVVKTADGGGRLASSPSAPKPAPEIAEPPKLAPKPATSALGQVPFTTGTIADGSKLPGLATRADAPKPMPPAVAPSLTTTQPTEPPKSQPRIGGEAIATESPKPLPSAVAPSLTATKPSEPLKSQPSIGGEAQAKSAARRRHPLPFADISSMLRLHAEGRYAFDIEHDIKRVVQDYFGVEAEALDQLLARFGLDEKGIAARIAASRRAALARGAWFEPGASVQHQEHAYGGCVVLGSESLADNDGKVLIQFDGPSGEGRGPRLLVDPAELMLTRIWHPEHGLGTFLSEDEDGEVCVVFDDKEGSSHVMGAEVSTCVPFDPKSLADRDGKMVRHPYLGHGLVVGEEDGKLIVVLDDRYGSAHINPAELSNSAPTVSVSLAAKSVAEIKAPDSFVAPALGQMDTPFTPGAIAAETPKPLETDHSAACLRDVPSPGRCPETRGTQSCD